jgi:hypothetical protein
MASKYLNTMKKVMKITVMNMIKDADMSIMKKTNMVKIKKKINTNINIIIITIIIMMMIILSLKKMSWI